MIEAAAAGFLLLLVVVALEADDAIHGIAEFFSEKSPPSHGCLWGNFRGALKAML